MKVGRSKLCVRQRGSLACAASPAKAGPFFRGQMEVKRCLAIQYAWHSVAGRDRGERQRFLFLKEVSL